MTSFTFLSVVLGSAACDPIAAPCGPAASDLTASSRAAAAILVSNIGQKAGGIGHTA